MAPRQRHLELRCSACGEVQAYELSSELGPACACGAVPGEGFLRALESLMVAADGFAESGFALTRVELEPPRSAKKAISSREREEKANRERSAALTAELQQLLREGRGAEAVQLAVNRLPDDAAEALLATAYCRHCKRRVARPTGAIGVDYARYLRAQCPECSAPLQLG